ncbi:hypothetical protein TELCIR_19293, partial [Teladorsagia circumcincta]
MKFIFTLLLIAGVAAASRYHLRLRYYFAPFLANLTKESKAEYRAILRDRSLTYDQEHEKLAEWANKYKRTEELEKFEAKIDESVRQLKENVPKLLASLPAAYNEYMSITESKDKTRSEILKELRKMLARNPRVYSVLKFVLSQYKRQYFPIHRFRRQLRIRRYRKS